MASRQKTVADTSYLLDLVTDCPGLTAMELSAKSGISTRKVRHYMTNLKAAGLARVTMVGAKRIQHWFPTLPALTEDMDNV